MVRLECCKRSQPINQNSWRQSRNTCLALAWPLNHYISRHRLLPLCVGASRWPPVLYVAHCFPTRAASVQSHWSARTQVTGKWDRPAEATSTICTQLGMGDAKSRDPVPAIEGRLSVLSVCSSGFSFVSLDKNSSLLPKLQGYLCPSPYPSLARVTCVDGASMIQQKLTGQ